MELTDLLQPYSICFKVSFSPYLPHSMPPEILICNCMLSVISAVFVCTLFLEYVSATCMVCIA